MKQMNHEMLEANKKRFFLQHFSKFHLALSFGAYSFHQDVRNESERCNLLHLVQYIIWNGSNKSELRHYVLQSKRFNCYIFIIKNRIEMMKCLFFVLLFNIIILRWTVDVEKKEKYEKMEKKYLFHKYRVSVKLALCPINWFWIGSNFIILFDIIVNVSG